MPSLRKWYMSLLDRLTWNEFLWFVSLVGICGVVLGVALFAYLPLRFALGVLAGAVVVLIGVLFYARRRGLWPPRW